MLDFPFAAAPAPGEVKEIRHGILWARLTLPFRLDHVNVYFLEDDDGWVIVDTGIDSRAGRAQWQALFDGPLAGARFSALICTHHHPDHIGLAGWLCETLGIPLLTTRTAFMSAMNFYNSPELLAATAYSRFYASHGMSPEIAALVSTQGQEYMRMLSKPPFTFRRIAHGDALTIGGRRFEALTGDGHCAEQLMLHLPEEGLFLAADQVLEKISPNVSVMAFEPDADPLGDFLASLAEMTERIPADVLVLGGHRLPFYGLHERAVELSAHHRERLDVIRTAVALGPHSAAELVPLMFRRELTPHEMSFAFTEVLAHMNRLIATDEVRWIQRADGTRALAG